MASFKQAPALSGGPLVQSRNFAVMTSVNARISCVMKRLRGKVNAQCSMVSAFGSGAHFSLVSGMGGLNQAAVKNRAYLKQPTFQTTPQSVNNNKTSVHLDSLRLLQWDKLCDLVASFAGTSLGREETKAQLWSLNQTYEESLRLLEETNAAVKMHQQGDCIMNFSSIDIFLVRSAIQSAHGGMAVTGTEAMATAVMLQCADNLQLNLKVAIKKDADWHNRFMPLSELIMELVISRPLMKLIRQLIDEDGSVKDSASSTLKGARNQVRRLELKISQLMENLIRDKRDEVSILGMNAINGRWCINFVGDLPANFQGLLLSSGSGNGSLVEPLSVIPLNDELQQARALVAKAEKEVLFMLTQKMQKDLDDVEMLLSYIIELDIINARATYSLSFGGSCPSIFLPEYKDRSLTAETYLSGDQISKASYSVNSEWILNLPKTCHPLLLQQHRHSLRKAKKDLRDATMQGEFMTPGAADVTLSSLEMEVTALESARPVPVDFFIAQRTRVLVITGPNTGGKTICLKTIGLAAMMAKSGLYILASEPAQIPWFDSVFADIGDEQSLSQSLSTFSGHLKQISDIQSQSTSQSLVLLDEVGAGTNPLEGAALGMAVLESFADSGAFLTIATTHHGELKTLKYSNDGFENACMEFDEINLKPTYKILWGIPGRSNAINIAERLGLPNIIVDNSRKLYGTASKEINEVIISMEKLKQDFQEHVHESQHYLVISRNLHERLLVARRKIIEHGTAQRHRKMRAISEAAKMARSSLHKKVQDCRCACSKKTSIPTVPDKSQKTAYHTQHKLGINSESSSADKSQLITASKTSSAEVTKHSPAPAVAVMKHSTTEKRIELPKVGDIVHISSLGIKGTVLKLEPSKDEIVVRAGIMTLKLKLKDIKS